MATSARGVALPKRGVAMHAFIKKLSGAIVEMLKNLIGNITG